LWEGLYNDFEEYKPVNLGFGGSTLAACGWFFDQLVAPIKSATKIIVYAGDNDLGDGRNPEEVYIFYRYFVLKLREHFNQIPLYFISIKPSIERVEITDKIIQANMLIEDEIKKSKGNEFFVDLFGKMITRKGLPVKNYFDADGLHLSKKGYELWKEIVQNECFVER
jgi:lysophospholipase L1-like esterase